MKLPLFGINDAGQPIQTYEDIENPVLTGYTWVDIETFIKDAIAVDVNRQTPLLLYSDYELISLNTAILQIPDVKLVPQNVKIAWSEQADILPLPYVSLCSKRVWGIRIYYPCIKIAWVKVTIWRSRVIQIATRFRPNFVPVKHPRDWSHVEDAVLHALGVLYDNSNKVTLFDLITLSYFCEPEWHYYCRYKNLSSALGKWYKFLVTDEKLLKEVIW